MSRRSERVDTYIANAKPFARPILQRIRSRFHQACPDLEETVKWGFPYFVKDGMVGGMSAFKVASVEELPEDTMLTGWIREAVALNESGYKRPKDMKRKDPESVSVPAELEVRELLNHRRA